MSKSAAVPKTKTHNPSPSADPAAVENAAPAETEAGTEKPRSALTIAIVALLMLVGLIVANMR